MGVPLLFPVAASSGVFGALVVAPFGFRVAAAVLLGALVGAIALWAGIGLARRLRDQHQRRPAPHLRLLLTANAWGYSERATLDESAVGL